MRIGFEHALCGGVLILVAGACSSQAPSALDPAVEGASAFTIDRESARERAFTAFESGQVRPLALSPDGAFLYATNTPDNRLEVFRVLEGRLQPVAAVPVGLEPVAVAARSDGQVWVVNHLSDSISVVDVRDPTSPRVVATLQVGDEPRDIVFAGRGHRRAFITTAHRGQNTHLDPQLTTPGVGRADVWVFDAPAPSLPSSTPLAVITLFADTPRALAATPDGATVYAAAFESGDRTTTIPERVVTRTLGLPPPHENFQGTAQPTVGLIVKLRPDPDDQGRLHWLDNIGRQWDAQVNLSLPDDDVFAIDADADPPAAKPGQTFVGVGTTLFNMAVNPVSGRVYVSNTDARNDVRFEGHDDFGVSQGAPPGTVDGHIAESRITVIDPASGQVTPRHLNKHIDYSKQGTPAEAAKTLAFPTEMAVTPDGKALLVAALGSSKVGVFSTSALETDSFVPSQADQIVVSGGGPTGIVLDSRRGVAYVLTRFDDGISIVDPGQRRETWHGGMFNPEPRSIVVGRPFLYDARLTSGHGDSACFSCHIFGDFDSLAWDLGNPDDFVTPIPGPFTLDPATMAQVTGNAPLIDHPLKGPMTTQSLRGLANHGPMHWRGDRTGGTDATRLNIVASAQPNTGTFDESAAFDKFNVAFAGLLGRSGPLTDDQMQAFTDFILQVTYPPNPIRALDDALTPDQQAGRDFFFNHDASGNEIASDTFHDCNGCHVLDPTGNAQFGVPKPGFFGTDGRYSFEDETQFFKVPHLRNLYQKVGMFGMPATFDANDRSVAEFLPPPYNDDSPTGNQVRGFGFLHDGSVDTVFRFHGATLFAQSQSNPGGFPIVTHPTDPTLGPQELQANLTLRRQVEAFMMAFDSNLAPIVGQQVTLAKGGDTSRVDLLEARAGAGDCDLVVKARLFGRSAGFLYDPATRMFRPDASRAPRLSDSSLRRLANETELTFTAVPVGSGVRIGLDRDLDGVLDGDE